MLTVIYI